MLLQPLIVGEFHGNNVDFKAFKLPISFQMVISGGFLSKQSNVLSRNCTIFRILANYVQTYSRVDNTNEKFLP